MALLTMAFYFLHILGRKKGVILISAFGYTTLCTLWEACCSRLISCFRIYRKKMNNHKKTVIKRIVLRFLLLGILNLLSRIGIYRCFSMQCLCLLLRLLVGLQQCGPVILFSSKYVYLSPLT